MEPAARGECLLRVLVTGARGMLGTDVVRELGGHDVVARDIEDFDIRDLEATVEGIRAAAPEAIVHLAAFTDVEACEDRRDLAFQCNVDGTRHVAVGAEEVGAYMLYVSTDYVFAGTRHRPYVETDEPAPINSYGLSKLEGERALARVARRHLILRTSWLFGPNGKNFIDTVVARARSGVPLKVVNDQHGCPTYTGHLAGGIRAALERQVEGIMHMTNAGETTWYDLAKYAFSAAGLDVAVESVPTSAYPTKARRPAYSVLGSVVREASGIEALPSWQEGVKQHLRRKGVIGDR